MNTLIKNGLFYSGNRNEKASQQDLLINENGEIIEIGSIDLTQNATTQIIDAKGKWILPGFIDSHTHYDAEILASPGLKESARHGVTSIILGSCSVSAIYNTPEDTSDSFTRVEAIPREVMLPLLQKVKTWNSPKEWKNYINQLPLGINVASFVGHSDMRMKVMGIDRSLSHSEKATKQEKQSMNLMLNEALDEGFLGLSTMDNPWDKMDGDRYWSHKTPSFYSSWKERKSLIEILRKRDAILQGAPNLVTRFNALNYMLASSGLFRKPLKTTMIAMMDLIGDRYIYPILAFASRAINVLGKANFRMQSPPCPFTVYYDGVDSVMFEEFPSGEALRHLAKEIDTRNELINDEQFRANFKKEIKNKFAPKVWHKDLSKSTIIACPDASMIGKNFYELAEEKNQHPVDLFLDTIIQYDKQMRWTTTIANDRKEKYKRLYNFPYNLISFSDAGAHLNNMAFYNFPLKMIKNVQESIDKGQPIMSMEKCVWRLTKEQADWFGLDCGHLAKGKVADLVLINPKNFHTVTEEIQLGTIQEFGNHERLVNRNDGVVSRVMVAGKTIFEKDVFVDGYGKATKYGRFLEKVI
ncbi:N-acyl-D-amino-acid deacylase family protein [Xanthomarina sp. F2636L]|uniref:N-acyl-D-amino-acid deacylase family protein n=1 Tax=Xanthomarina sp. F2636L TaxID=2996018 RepID=UPI00225E0EEE|nr:amidohydrolase family protein [Xanthomarina sp. F2636L]MCX7549864.1 amidohydrolase family protein [Xanthomarina sp. F2636L]